MQFQIVTGNFPTVFGDFVTVRRNSFPNINLRHGSTSTPFVFVAVTVSSSRLLT